MPPRELTPELKEEILLGMLGVSPSAAQQPTRNEQLAAQQRAGQTARQDLLQRQAPFQQKVPQQFAGPVERGVSGVAQPITQAAPPPQTTQPVGPRFEAQAQFNGVSGREGNTPNRPPAFSARQVPSQPRGFNRASNLDLQRSGQQGRLALASRSGRSAPFANNFQFRARQGRGGRQPVFSAQDQAFRQRFQEQQSRNVRDQIGRTNVFANRGQRR